jgi:clan AA aspartic protease
VITGVVNSDLEATIRVQILGPTGQQDEVTAVIDTGYNGDLSLPLAVVTALSLSPLASRSVRLGDASRKVLNFYRARIHWDGQVRTVRVLCVEEDPLIGTGLLEGFDLKVEFVAGGRVTLEARP